MNKRFLLSLTVALVLLVGLVGPGVAAAQPPQMAKVLIGFDRQPGPGEEALVRGVGGSIKYTYHLVPAIAASVPEAAIDGLLRNQRVTRVEPDIEVRAIDQVLPWGVNRIDAEVVHSAGNKGAAVKVAVLDTGIDLEHPDLSVAGWVNFAGGGKDADDKNGHGTHVAGTIAALDNTIGVIGVAPDVSLYAVKVLGNGGFGDYSDVIAGLQWAVDNGMQVTNNSYGSTGDPGQTVKDAFDAAYAAGIINIAAAGNEYGDDVIYPARYESVVAVSATTINDTLASFSSVGPEVELAAPGQDIYSTYKDGDYATLSGTSMASPHVAGTAALVIAAGIVSDGDGSYGIANEVRDRLNATAEDIGLSATEQGNGLVDAEAATGASLATGSIAGTVTSAEDGTAIAGATVLVEDTGQSATTGTDGTYAIADVPAGDHTVTASADGFESSSQVVTVLENQTTTADFALNPAPTAVEMYVWDMTWAEKHFGRGGSFTDLSITVDVNQDSDGDAVAENGDDPASNAAVTLVLTHDTDGDGTFEPGSDDDYWTFQADTNSEGQITFTLKFAPAGNYQAEVTDLTHDTLVWNAALDGDNPDWYYGVPYGNE